MQNSKTFLGTILPYADYNDKFRRDVAIYAINTGSYQKAAGAYKVAVSSAWRWVKAFGLSQEYHRTKQKPYTDDPFILHHYPSEFRNRCARYALLTNTKLAAEKFNVSRGSVDNWIKAWQANNAYLNR
jgi:transposase